MSSICRKKDGHRAAACEAQGRSVEDQIGGGIEETHGAANEMDRGGIECRIAGQRVERAWAVDERDAVKEIWRV
jgi:hypothetical protein